MPYELYIASTVKGQYIRISFFGVSTSKEYGEQYLLICVRSLPSFIASGNIPVVAEILQAALEDICECVYSSSTIEECIDIGAFIRTGKQIIQAPQIDVPAF